MWSAAHVMIIARCSPTVKVQLANQFRAAGTDPLPMPGGANMPAAGETFMVDFGRYEIFLNQFRATYFNQTTGRWSIVTTSEFDQAVCALLQ